MALQKIIMPLVFSQGIETKTDSKQQMIGVLRSAKNIIWETIGQLRKRNGYDEVILRDTEGVRITNVDRTSKFKNELLVFAENRLWSFSESLQRLSDKGAVYSATPESLAVLNNSYNHNTVDSLVVSGFTVFVYHNSTLNDVRYSVQDNETGSLLVSDDVVAASSEFIRVGNINNTVFVVYASGTDVFYKSFNVYQPENLSTAAVLANNLSAADPRIDVTSSSTKVFVAYNSTVVGAAVRVVSILSDGSLGTGVGINGSNNAESLHIFLDSLERLVVSWSESTTVNYAIANFTLLGLLLTPTVIETVSNCNNITAVETEEGVYQFHYQITVAASYNHFLRQNTGDVAGVVGTPAPFVRSLGLAAKSFKVNDAVYVVTAYQSDLQSTYFILDSDGNAVVKFSPQIGGGHAANGVLPTVWKLSETKVLIPSLIKGKSEADNGVFFSLLGVLRTFVEFDPPVKFDNVLLGENLHIAGGVLQAYDGDMVVEHGFHVFPESVAAGANSPTGGSMSDGNYGYLAVYRWTDNGGQEHFSVPSVPVDVVLSAGGTTQTQAISVPTLRLTAKTNVVLELYRTENNGTIYYLTSSTTMPTFNDKTVDAITIVDTTSDTALISRQALYTTGGVLENDAPPSATVLSVHTASNRVFLTDEDPNLLIYSKIRESKKPVEFSSALVIPVDPVGGDITAHISMDEKLIIFEEGACFYIAGGGPNNLGEQDTFTTPERISTDIGCIEPRSVVLTPDGVMFKSRKGIYLLTRGLELQYVGAPVEEFNSLGITSAKVIGSKNQVRFTTQNGECLVYNYFLKLWGTFDNHAANSAEVIGDDYYYIRTDSSLFIENSTSFSDNGSAISMSIETGWMSFNQLQGFQRVYKMMVLGAYKSPHMLKVEVAYDFNEAYVDEKIITPTDDFVSDSRYGDDSPYGAGSPYGGDGNVYQARFNFDRQKCQAIKLRISDVQSQVGEGLSLSAFTLQIGGKAGVNKVGVNRKYGVT